MNEPSSSQPSNMLKLDEERVGRSVVVRLYGSAGMEGAELLKLRLREIALSAPALVVLDMDRLDFLYSEALEAILSCHVVVSRRGGGRVCLANPKPRVRELFETTRLNLLFPIFSSVEQALQAEA